MPGAIVAAQMASVVTNVWLNFALLRAHGIVGASVASTISYTGLAFVSVAYAFIRRRAVESQ
jgi:Na+-driven multidrug efflux pump